MAAPAPSRLDANQVLQGAFDENTGRLRTDSEATVVNADIDVQLTPDEDGVHIGDKTNGNTAAVDAQRNLAVKDQAVVNELVAQTSILNDIEAAVSGPQTLPTGAATEAKQDVGNASLASIDSKVSTAAKQDVGNASLASIDSKVATEATVTSINNKLDDLHVITGGTIDGTESGQHYLTVNNLRQQILASHDRTQAITYADFGTKDQRITQVDYASSTFSGFIARKTITYTLVSGRYRRDSINWSII